MLNEALHRLGKRLFTAPLLQDDGTVRILDLGTGTGSWVIDTAQ